MVTVSDIAREAGVCRYTVSKVLNGDRTVKDATRKRVKEICKRLGYIPNRNALNLVRGRSNCIALVVPYITDGFYAEMIEHLEKSAVAHGYMLLYQSTYNDPKLEAAAIENLLSLKICGMCIVPTVRGTDFAIHELAGKNVPVIYLDRPLNAATCCVLNDNRQSAREMTSHLLTRTADVAYLGSFYGSDNPTAEERHLGYLDAMAERGLEPRCLPLEAGNEKQDNERFAYDNVSAFLRAGNFCKALFCITDAAAAGAIAAFREAGFLPGAEVFVGGHDDLRFGEFAQPPITTMHQPVEEICAAALKLLDAAVKGTPPEKRRYVFPSRLIVRKSG